MSSHIGVSWVSRHYRFFYSLIDRDLLRRLTRPIVRVGFIARRAEPGKGLVGLLRLKSH